MLYSTFGKYLPASMEQRKYGWKKVTIPLIMPEPEDIELTKGQALSSLVGLAFSAAYAAKRHYLLNNGLGLAYSIEVRTLDGGAQCKACKSACSRVHER